MSPGHQNGAMGSQNGTLGYPNGAKMEPWGTQMEPKWCPKVPKYGVLDSAGDHILEHFIPQSIDPESPSNLESPSNPPVLPVLRIAKGAGGRGEALRFAAPPKGEPGVLDYSACPVGRIAPRGYPDEVRPCRRPRPITYTTETLFSDLIFERLFGPTGCPKGPQGSPKIA